MENEDITNVTGLESEQQSADDYAEALSLVYERQARRYGRDLPESEELR